MAGTRRRWARRLALVLASLGGAVLPLASFGQPCPCCGAPVGEAALCPVGWPHVLVLVLPFLFFGAALVLVHVAAPSPGERGPDET